MITEEMVEAGIEEIRKAKHTCFDRWTDHEAIRAVLEAAAAETIAALSEENERLRKERDEMADWIKSATTTISDAIGGGSEMFVRRGEAYRIDPRFVANYIETRRGDLHEARVAIVKLRKEAAQ